MYYCAHSQPLLNLNSPELSQPPPHPENFSSPPHENFSTSPQKISQPPPENFSTPG